MGYTKDDIRVLLEDRVKALQAVREDGQKEYAHNDDRPFRNFEVLAAELGIPRERVCWVYLRKHLDGVLAYVKGHRSQREPIAGRFKDLHLYLYLLEFMLLEDSFAAHGSNFQDVNEEPQEGETEYVSTVRR